MYFPPKNMKNQPAKMHPADHMSMEVEYILAPKRTSGGLYHSVTTCKNIKGLEPHQQNKNQLKKINKNFLRWWGQKKVESSIKHEICQR